MCVCVCGVYVCLLVRIVRTRVRRSGPVSACVCFTFLKRIPTRVRFSGSHKFKKNLWDERVDFWHRRRRLFVSAVTSRVGGFRRFILLFVVFSSPRTKRTIIGVMILTSLSSLKRKGTLYNHRSEISLFSGKLWASLYPTTPPPLNIFLAILRSVFNFLFFHTVSPMP